jgi:hypothetical protein
MKQLLLLRMKTVFSLNVCLIFLFACLSSFSEQNIGGIELSRIALQKRNIPTNSFHFVVWGDSQFMNNELFCSIVSQTESISPSFVVQVGDLTLMDTVENEQEALRQWNLFKKHIQPLTAPFFPVPGNHDLNGPVGVRIWKDVWGPLYYSFDYCNSHFIVLNSFVKVETNEPALGVEQTAWLMQDLQKSTAENVFVFMHHPIWFKKLSWQPYHELFMTNRVRAVFGGHTHVYDYMCLDNIHYIVTVASQEKHNPHDIETGRFPHLIHVTVTGKTASATIYYNGQYLPPTTVDLITKLLNINKMTQLIPLSEDSINSYTMTFTNATYQIVTTKYTWIKDNLYTWQPSSGEVTLPPKTQIELPVTVTRLSKDPARLPQLKVDVSFRKTDGTPTTIQRTLPMMIRADLTALNVPNQIKGRVILLGSEKIPSLRWLMKQMQITPVNVETAEDFQIAVNNLKPADILINTHMTFDENHLFTQCFIKNLDKINTFVNSGGKLILTCGFSTNSVSLITNMGLKYHRHTRAWGTDYNGNRELLLIPENSPLKTGLTTNCIVYTAIPMMNGWLEESPGKKCKVLATDNLGQPVVVAWASGQGLTVVSCARLGSKHHIRDNYDLQRIWVNLLLLNPAKLSSE